MTQPAAKLLALARPDADADALRKLCSAVRTDIHRNILSILDHIHPEAEATLLNEALAEVIPRNEWDPHFFMRWIENGLLCYNTPIRQITLDEWLASMPPLRHWNDVLCHLMRLIFYPSHMEYPQDSAYRTDKELPYEVSFDLRSAVRAVYVFGSAFPEVPQVVAEAVAAGVAAEVEREIGERKEIYVAKSSPYRAVPTILFYKSNQLDELWRSTRVMFIHHLVSRVRSTVEVILTKDDYSAFRQMEQESLQGMNQYVEFQTADQDIKWLLTQFIEVPSGVSEDPFDMDMDEPEEKLMNAVEHSALSIRMIKEYIFRMRHSFIQSIKSQDMLFIDKILYSEEYQRLHLWRLLLAIDSQMTPQDFARYIHSRFPFINESIDCVLGGQIITDQNATDRTPVAFVRYLWLFNMRHVQGMKSSSAIQCIGHFVRYFINYSGLQQQWVEVMDVFGMSGWPSPLFFLEILMQLQTRTPFHYVAPAQQQPAPQP